VVVVVVLVARRRRWCGDVGVVGVDVAPCSFNLCISFSISFSLYLKLEKKKKVRVNRIVPTTPQQSEKFCLN
jgi:hypothetical protein